MKTHDCYCSICGSKVLEPLGAPSDSNQSAFKLKYRKDISKWWTHLDYDHICFKCGERLVESIEQAMNDLKGGNWIPEEIK